MLPALGGQEGTTHAAEARDSPLHCACFRIRRSRRDPRSSKSEPPRARCARRWLHRSGGPGYEEADGAARAPRANPVGGLGALLSRRTRLVALSHASNLLGGVEDVAGAARLAKDATDGAALVVVDGVALAPHRSVDAEVLRDDISHKDRVS